MNSWGNYPKLEQKEHVLDRIPDALPNYHYLPQGYARSYGDSCLSTSGNLLVTRELDHLINFENGILECEAGVSILQLNKLLIDQGWFIPVTPGTQHVSLGGAIANDIHGKNHHTAGTIGRFVTEIDLLRGMEKQTLSLDSDLFQATIGGMGLTGLITKLKIQLKAIASRYIETELVPFKNLDEFFKISDESSKYEYTVAWLDCVSTGNNFGKGIFYRGNHTDQVGKRAGNLSIPVPFNFPNFTLNKYSIKLFNTFYYFMMSRKGKFIQDLIPFFYPLDAVTGWNKIYGEQGFLQFQCVIPKDEVLAKKLLKMITDSGKASFLAVFKEFGSISSPGLISFPRPGLTLALDFPADPEGIKLVQALNDFVCENGGALYPAKDALMTAEHFRHSYPGMDKFKKFIHPNIDSVFAKRVGLI